MCLRELGFTQFQAEPTSKSQLEGFDHMCPDGFINHHINDDLIELHDMLPETISSTLGILPPVAKEIAAKWEVVFSANPVLFHGKLDYTMFVREFFLQQLRYPICSPLPPAVLQPSASNRTVSLPLQQFPVHVRHVTTDQWKDRGLFRDYADMVASQYHPDNHVLLYHGTSRDVVGDIVENGVKPTYGSARQDFSNADARGYYCSPNIEEARSWAYLRFPDNPTVIVHAIPKVEFNQLNRLAFEHADANWAALVTECRCRNRLPLGFPRYDAIGGPMCSNPDDVKNHQAVPMPHDPPKTQWCALSEDCAALLTRNLVGMVFVPPPPGT